MNTNYYIKAEEKTLTTHLNHTVYNFIQITRISKKPFDGRNFKVSFDETSKKQGKDGIWEKAVKGVRDLFEHHERPVLVQTTDRLGFRTARNRAYREAMSPIGILY